MELCLGRTDDGRKPSNNKLLFGKYKKKQEQSTAINIERNADRPKKTGGTVKSRKGSVQ